MKADCGHEVIPTVREMSLETIPPGEWKRMLPGVIHPIRFPKLEKVLFIPACCEMCEIMREANGL